MADMGTSDAPKKFAQLAGGVFLLCAASVMIWQMTGPSWFKNIKAEVTAQPYARTISVSGEGKVTSKPDMGVITLAVVAQGKTVKAVTQDGNTRMTAITDAVKKFGIDPKDLVTSSYNLYPRYAYPDNSAAVITGYELNQGLTVKVRKLEDVDDVLDGAITAGANQVGQLSFEIDEDSALMKEARGKAFADAKKKADEMTAAAGVRLGRVVTFSEGGGYNPPPVYYDMMAGAKAESSMAPSIEPGSQELNVTVSVTYEIE
jgi:hypothetical protein